MNVEPPADLPGLNNLHARENDEFEQHRRAALDHPHWRGVLRLVHHSLDFMIEVAGGSLHTDEAGTMSAIAGRIFNTTAGAQGEALNGYPQRSFLLQRDLIEITRCSIDRGRILRATRSYT